MGAGTDHSVSIMPSDHKVQAGQHRRPTAIELFCGAGGMTLGFEAAGFDVLVSVDNDPLHLATHEWNFPHTYVECADVAQADPKRLVAAAEKTWRERYPGKEWPGTIDCIFGGPSCQGFSEIGRRDPQDQRNLLLSSFARIVAAILPRYFVIENVPGMLDPRNASIVADALTALESAGYTLWDTKPVILDSANFGVPQARRRVFIVGARNDAVVPRVPESSAHRITVQEAVDDLRHLERYTSLYRVDDVRVTDVCLQGIERDASDYAKSLRCEPTSPGPWSLAYPRHFDRSLLTSCGRTAHADAVAARFRRTRCGTEEVVSRLPRLAPHGVASTLRAGTGRDHGSFTSARPIHYLYPRVITVREAARLHSFPDWFRFHATKWHGFRQVGNAVPPLLAREVAQTLVSALAIVPGAPRELLSPPVDRRLLSYSLTEAAEHYAIPLAHLPKDSRRPSRGATTGTG